MAFIGRGLISLCVAASFGLFVYMFVLFLSVLTLLKNCKACSAINITGEV